MRLNALITIPLLLLPTALSFAFPSSPLVPSLLVPRHPTSLFASKSRSKKKALQVESLKRSGSPSEASAASTIRDSRAISDLKLTIKRAGQTGQNASEAEREEIRSLCGRLKSSQDASYPAINRAKHEISGKTYGLLYSTSSGPSSGKIGPFVGSVTQRVINDVDFVNSVSLGPLEISLRATMERVTDTRINVAFREMSFVWFGMKLRSVEVEGKGVWNVMYAGEVDGKSFRVMETPNLFVLEELK